MRGGRRLGSRDPRSGKLLHAREQRSRSTSSRFLSLTSRRIEKMSSRQHVGRGAELVHRGGTRFIRCRNPPWLPAAQSRPRDGAQLRPGEAEEFAGGRIGVNVSRVVVSDQHRIERVLEDRLKTGVRHRQAAVVVLATPARGGSLVHRSVLRAATVFAEAARLALVATARPGSVELVRTTSLAISRFRARREVGKSRA